ncbi:hypothetical protein [Corynebacterium durum]
MFRTRPVLPSNEEGLAGLRVLNNWPAIRAGLTITEETNIMLRSDPGERSPYSDTVTQGAMIVPRTLFFAEEQTKPTSRLGRVQSTVTVQAFCTAQEKTWKTLPFWLSGQPPCRLGMSFDVHLGSTIVPFQLFQP